MELRRIVSFVVLAACGSDPGSSPDAPGIDARPDASDIDASVDAAVDAGLSTQIVFKSGNDIWVMDANGGNPQNLTNTVTVNEDQPVWSPDKTKIAFHSNADDVGEIYVMNADGSDVQRLTTEVGENDAWPTWSPDGTKIAFTSRRDHLIASIYVMNANGTDPQRLTNLPPYSDDMPAWSPDGASIAFTTNEDTNQHIALVDASGANRRRVTPNTVSATMATWSPNSTMIACALGTPTQIYVIAPDGGGQTQVTTLSSQAEEHPTWSRDGSHIAFDRNVNGQTHIFTIAATGGGELDIAGPAGAPIDPSW